MKRSDKYYAESMLKGNKSWQHFAGVCYLTAITNELPLKDVNEYIFETFHTLGKDEVPKNKQDIADDLEIFVYQKNGWTY